MVYRPTDPLFADPPPARLLAQADLGRESEVTCTGMGVEAPPGAVVLGVGEAVELYLPSRTTLAATSRTDARRVFTWLRECVGETTLLTALSKASLRGFRDQLLHLNGGHQGRGGLSFRQRQTSKPEARISTKTAEKYWSFVSRFLRWCVDEGHLDANPGAGLRVEVAREDTSHSPNPSRQRQWPVGGYGGLGGAGALQKGTRDDR